MQNQMQHVAGVLKREPCHKCKLPVFLAERLLHGSRLYHRTCLRCARCQSQLTPGSFYETEMDGEFCCETCPDEDATAAAAAAVSVTEDAKDEIDVSATESGQQSFTSKLALFQMRTAAAVEESGKGLLAKSLSDEEKSKSLKRLTAFYSAQSTDGGLGLDYNSGGVMSSFMSTQLLDEQVQPNPHQVEESDDDEEDDEGEDDEDSNDNDEPPSLPTAQPPPADESFKSSVVIAMKPLGEVSSKSIATEKPPLPAKPLEVIALRASPLLTPFTVSQTFEETQTYPSDKTLLKADPSKETQKPEIQNFPAIEISVINLSDDSKQPNETKVSDQLSGVRARLVQFESISANEKPITSSNASSFQRRIHKERSPSPDPVVPVAVTVLLEDVDQPSTHDVSFLEPNPITRELEHFQELAMRQAVTEINDEVAEHELERAEEVAADTVASPEEETVVPTPRKRTPKLAKVDPKPTAKLRTTTSIEAKPELIVQAPVTPSVEPKQSYPLEFNPFGDDEDVAEEAAQIVEPNIATANKRNSFNPFDSSDDEVELDKVATLRSKPVLTVHPKNSRQSLNPFGSESDDEETIKRTPVPTPRKITLEHSSLHTTPEPTPRPSRASSNYYSVNSTPHNNSSSIGYYDHDSSSAAPSPLNRNQQLYGSISSLTSTSSSLNTYTRRRKNRAPLPPTSFSAKLDKLTGSEPASLSPSPSVRNTPTLSRKKRPAPAPPSATKTTPVVTRLENDPQQQEPETVQLQDARPDRPRLSTIPSQDSTDYLRSATPPPDYTKEPVNEEIESKPNHVRKLIPLDVSLIEPSTERQIPINIPSSTPATEVVYRRTIMPIEAPASPGTPPICGDTHDRQWQKVKENKESLNKNRQSQCSVISSPDASECAAPTDTALYSNKSTYGKWKRRKGPAPSLPKLTASSMMMATSSSSHHRTLNMLPLQEIRYELEVIEVQQQGLEKQGIQLEKMIRERCEGGAVVMPIEELANTPNTKEVEDLILQLFEIVNEKNELFRRQAELMYIRRLHRLEQEQAQIEFDIRMLMAQPESNKTDSDKAREDALIARKVEIVLQRNEVIDCLDADRLREAEEDQSIKLRLELHNARREEELPTPTKLSKKEKKKLRETKKLAKQKKMDADKDADESEVKAVADAATKKKRKFLF